MLRLASYVLMAIAFWLLLSHVGPTERYVQLARAGVPAEAVVVRPDCANHATFIYHFEVEGRQFESHDHASPTGRDCDSLKAGEKVGIFYLPTDPSVSMVGNLTAQLRGERTFVALTSLAMPGFILWAFARRRRLNENA